MYTTGKLFCDLDGVLADFDSRVIEIMGKHPNDVPDKIMWPTILKYPGGFFRNLEWMKDGKELWEYILPYEPSILTGVSRSKKANQEKIDWCAKKLGDDVEVICCYSKDKQNWVTSKYDILIDDRLDNCERWQKAGGTAIFHVNTRDTLCYLAELGYY